MDDQARIAARRRSVWYDPAQGDPEAFERLVSQDATASDWPQASGIAAGRVPVYDATRLPTAREARKDLMAEWARVFRMGPGIIVLRGALPRETVDTASAVLEQLIEAEVQSGGGGGDHFAKPGANDRLWNAVQKHCEADPENWADYYACDAMALASEAWLGPAYQVTAQVNRVNPGGAAQVPHRDYHLGFMSREAAAGWPAHAHALSPSLTLQGAISHCDMTLEQGPTMLLPFSQLAPDGYVTFQREDYRDVFNRLHVQMPMETGDAVFFNPAVMHGAGENRTSDKRRLVNLFQVSSAFGRAIESVDRTAMCRAAYAALGRLQGQARANAIAACAEGYPFPTNLDRNPPVGGMAPASQAAVLTQALDEGWDVEMFNGALDDLEARNRP